MRGLTVAILLVMTSAAGADSLLDTTDEVRMRQDAARYEQWQRNGDRPLGGYRESLGQPYPGAQQSNPARDPYRSSGSIWGDQDRAW